MARRGGGALLAVCVWLIAQAGLAAWDDDAQVLLTVGDEIPGLGRVGIYGVEPPLGLDDSGRVVFRATSSDGVEGLYRGTAEGLTTLWSTRAPGPIVGHQPLVEVSRAGRIWLVEFPRVYELRDGAPEPVASLIELLPPDEQFCGGEFGFAVNERGDLAFQLAVAPRATGCDASDAPAGNESTAIYLRVAGAAATQLVARRSGDSDHVFDQLRLFRLTDDGVVLFTAALDDGSADGLLGWRDGAAAAVVTTLTLRPNGAALGFFTPVAEDGADDVLLIAGDDQALYRSVVGELQRVIGPGEIGPAGLPIAAVVDGRVNAAGDITAVVRWDGPPNPPFIAERYGVMFITAGGVPVAVAADATTGLLNARGEVASYVLGGPPGTPLLLQQGAYAVALWHDGATQRIAADGDLTPSGDVFASQWLIASGLRLAADGRVLLNTLSAEKQQALVCHDAAGFHAIVRQGDAAPGGGVFTEFGQIQEVDGALLFAASTAATPHTYDGPLAIYRASATRLERVLGEGDVAENGIVIRRLVDAISDGAGIPFHEAARIGFSAAPDGTVLIHADSTAGRQRFRLHPGGVIEVARLGAARAAQLAADGSVIAAQLRGGDPAPPSPDRYGAIVRWDGGPAAELLLAYDDPVFDTPARLFSGFAVHGQRIFFQVGPFADAWYVYAPDEASLAVVPPRNAEPHHPCSIPVAFTPAGRLLCQTFDDPEGPWPYLLADAISASLIAPLRDAHESVDAINDRGDALLFADRTADGVLRGRLRRAGSDGDIACPLPPPVDPEASPTTPSATPTPTPRTCSDAECVRIVARVGAGRAGELVTLEVRLDSATAPVAGVQNDLAVDPQVAAIVAAEDGRPACRVNPAIDKNGTVFAFLSNGGMRALVLALDNVDPIADGALLYTCDVRVAAGASPGRYPLRVYETGASDDNGLALRSTGDAGELEVLSDAEVPVEQANGDGGGCAVASPRRSVEPLNWFGLGALLGLVARRITSSRGAGGSRR